MKLLIFESLQNYLEKHHYKGPLSVLLYMLIFLLFFFTITFKFFYNILQINKQKLK